MFVSDSQSDTEVLYTIPKLFSKILYTLPMSHLLGDAAASHSKNLGVKLIRFGHNLIRFRGNLVKIVAGFGRK